MRSDSGRHAVLVVEDDPIVRDIVVQVLEDEGYEVLEAADAAAALKALETPVPVHLLVTDVGLPGMNGRQLAEAARLNRQALKVLFMTGHAQQAVLDGVTRLEAVEVIAKPFQLDDLAARVRSMLDA